MNTPPLGQQKLLAVLKDVEKYLADDEADTQRLIKETGFSAETIRLYKALRRIPQWLRSKGGPNATWKTRLKFKWDMVCGLARLFKSWAQLKVLKSYQKSIYWRKS